MLAQLQAAEKRTEHSVVWDLYPNRQFDDHPYPFPDQAQMDELRTMCLDLEANAANSVVQLHGTMGFAASKSASFSRYGA